jgi:hypothetical protein
MPHRLSSQIACFGIVALLASAQPLFSQRLRADGPDASGPTECGRALPGKRVSRTEIFLGLSKPDGSTVTEAEFQHFIDTEVAAQLPDGFTIVAGHGQFKDARGAIIRERARVLVVLHPVQDGASSERIEKVRAAYKATFRQESVLRVDGESCASF